MDFDLTDEQIQFRETVISFAEKELSDDVIERDRKGAFSRELWQKCANFGLVGLTAPEEFGGQGADALTAVIALEALGAACRDNGLIFSLNAHLWSAVTPIARFGSDPQRERWLPGLCNGSLIGVQAMTEPDSGSDAFALTTRAIRDGSEYVLNGSKTYITNAPVADVFVVFATTDRAKGWGGLCAFLVERDTPGFTIGAPFDKMGLRTSPMSELHFDDCTVAAESLLGKEGSGMSIFNHSIDWERSCILAAAVGTMQRQLDQCIAHAKSRRQFGQHIGNFQAVSHRIVDMKVRLDTSRLLLYRMAWMKTMGRSTPVESAMVKLFVSENWVASGLDQIQIHGAYGYMTESGIERDLRDALASRIYSGTSEIQRNLLAHHLGLSRPSR